MSKSVTELLPVISTLSRTEKLQLVQLILAELGEHNHQETARPFHPQKFFGIAQQSKAVVDDYLASLKEGWL